MELLTLPIKIFDVEVPLWVVVLVLVAVVNVAGPFINQTVGTGALDPFVAHINLAAIAATIARIWNFYALASLLFTAALLYGVVYAGGAKKAIDKTLWAQVLAAEERYRELTEGAPRKNKRLEEMRAHSMSQNPNDWRIAIVEADIILEEALDALGLPGVTIGEKLRNANPQSLTTLQDAWDAHKVRNLIAHEGSGFELTDKIARETMLKYERVFEELQV